MTSLIAILIAALSGLLWVYCWHKDATGVPSWADIYLALYPPILVWVVLVVVLNLFISKVLGL